jgi:hypothetical protein
VVQLGVGNEGTTGVQIFHVPEGCSEMNEIGFVGTMKETKKRMMNIE